MVDTFSHGLWTYIIFNSFLSGKFLWLAIFFGMAPDLFSWTIYALYKLIKDRKFGRPNLNKIPQWVFTLYGLTHSIFSILLVFIIVYLINGNVPIFLLAWPIHVLIDIPTHSGKFLPTPFLWPIFEWKFPGISWGEPWLFALDWILIIIFIVKKILFN